MQSAASLDRLLIQGIASICDMEESGIAPETTLGELAMDSLRITALCAHIEALYECPVRPDDVVELLEAACVGDLLATLRRMTGRPTP